MTSARCGRRVVRILAALGLLAILRPAAPAHAQSASAPALKAAFLYNFAKFTEWPADALRPGEPMVLCVIDEPKVARALEEATAGRNANGHTVVVKRMEADGPVRSCHLLYADRLDGRSGAALIEQLAGAPVLSVSDFPGFAPLGGVAHLFVEDGRMRFAVNVDAISRSNLRLSSRLLSLAVIVKDHANASPR